MKPLLNVVVVCFPILVGFSFFLLFQYSWSEGAWLTIPWRDRQGQVSPELPSEGRSDSPGQASPQNDDATTGEVETNGVPFGKVKHAPILDPQGSGLFLVSFAFRLDSLPTVGRRQNVIAKYLKNEQPYTGWAIAFNHFPTSLRPEVYWRGKNGTGGWFTFDRVEVELNRWYSLTLLVEHESHMNLYFERLAKAKDASGVVEEDLLPIEDFESRDGVVFLGGYDIAQVRTPKTNADLMFGASHSNSRGIQHRGIQGDISNFLIAYPQRIGDNIEERKSFLSGGPQIFEKQLAKDQVNLFVTEGGVDQSAFGHIVGHSAAAVS